MCRSTDIHSFYQIDRDRLKIKAFYLRLSVSKSRKPLPESLTLVYLPRITGSPLEIDDSKIRPDSSAFVTLHRLISEGEAVFGSRDRVRASEGVRFEVYLGEEKILKGIFRKDEDEEWYMECKCALERKLVGAEVSEAEVCVAVEGHVAMIEKVKMAVKRKKKGVCFQGLEEIPEEREVESDDSEEGGCCCCSGGEAESGLDGGDYKEEEEDGGTEEMEMEMEMEGVRWAVDVGIWVMCLGVGFLVSAKTLRRRRIL